MVFAIIMVVMAAIISYQTYVEWKPSPNGHQWNATVVAVIVMVKNEEAILGRLLQSVAPFATTLFVCDTGSTDGTQQVVARSWPTLDYEFKFIGKFHNFETSRNLCMDAARAWMPTHIQWLLLPDADFTLALQPGLPLVMPQEFDLNIMQIRPNNALPLLVSARAFFGSCRYRLWTHEVLDCCNDSTTTKTGYYAPLYWVDHSDGASRPDKLRRDINLLEEWIYHYNRTLAKSPTERRQDLYGRALYYLARAHEDSGALDEALDLYRVHQMNQPWTNYQFQGLYRMAIIQLNQFRAKGGDWRPVEAAFLEAYGGPDGYFRREVLYYLMWMFSDLHQWNRCILYASAGLSAPPVDHSRMPLFLEAEKYELSLFQKGLDYCVHHSKNSPIGAT